MKKKINEESIYEIEKRGGNLRRKHMYFKWFMAHKEGKDLHRDLIQIELKHAKF